MALIKCPECKKEISDTIKKCPHCGFKIKNNIDFKELLKNNKKMVYTIIGILLLVIFILFLIIGGKDSKNAKKVISYLQNNGYICNKGSYNFGRLDEKELEKAISCTYTEGKVEHQYIIRTKDKFEVQYVFISNEYTTAEYSFKIFDHTILSLDFINLYKDGVKRGKYISTGNNFIDGKAKVEKYCDDDYYVKNKDYDKCGDLGDYLKDVNNAIDNFKQLYNDVDIELES